MLEQRQLVFTIVYGALFTCLGMYGLVAFLVTNQPGQAMTDPTPLRALVGLAALNAVVVLPLLRGKLMPPRRAATSLTEATPAPSPESNAAIARLFTAHIVTWALCESIGIFGLVATLLYRDLRYYTGFAVAAALSFIVCRPSLELTRSVVRAARVP